jgi:hypothetical protein
MKRLLVATALVAFTAAITLGAITLITGRAATIGRSTSAPSEQEISDPIAPELEQGLQESGITLTGASTSPQVSRDEAMQTASNYLPAANKTNPTATYTLATRQQTGVSEGMQPNEDLNMQERPVWIVFFGATTSAIAGPANSPLQATMNTSSYVFIDANTGEPIMALEESKEPVTAP